MSTLAQSSTSNPAEIGIVSEQSRDTSVKVEQPGQAETDETLVQKEFRTPAQDKLSSELGNQRNNLLKLEDMKSCGLATSDNLKQIKDAKATIHSKQLKLKRLQADSRRQKARRLKLKTIIKGLALTSKDLKQFSHTASGRPIVEENQCELHNAIIALATHGAGADRRRRTELLSACLTLDDLASELKKQNYHLSRSAVYLRLMPRRSDTTEGKKHIHSVPVKLRRPENTERKGHANANFAFATKGYFKSIASIFGPDAVFVLSIDDKAKVPIGLAAANKQAPLLMCLEYSVRLPDHDFVIAGRHKLTPSVYAACAVKASSRHAEMEICYSGPTYIAVRSAKHDGSTAFTHGRDIERLVELEPFQSVMKHDGIIKPIFLAFVDGGPDENPRFPNTIDVAVQRFKKFNLDAYLAMTHAPGMSAYNYVERRMAPLSRELTGVILPHDSFGSHLDASGRTTDSQLEKENFKKAGEILAEIWNTLVIDDYPVTAEYVQDASVDAEGLDERWMAIHCRISQYTLTIVKCLDQSCCGNFRTSWLNVFPNRFLPAPFPVRLTSLGPKVPEPADVTSDDKFMSLWQRQAINLKPKSAEAYIEVPYDMYCPSVQGQALKSRICGSCQLYLPSAAAVSRHRRSGGCRCDEAILTDDIVSEYVNES